METETTAVDGSQSHPIQMGIKIAAATALLAVGVHKLGRKAKAKYDARKAAKTTSTESK